MYENNYDYIGLELGSVKWIIGLWGNISLWSLSCFEKAAMFCGDSLLRSAIRKKFLLNLFLYDPPSVWAVSYNITNFHTFFRSSLMNNNNHLLIHTAGSDHYFHTSRPFVRPSARPHFSKSRKTINFEVRIVIATVGVVGLTEWIIDEQLPIQQYFGKLSLCSVWSVAEDYNFLRCKFVSKMYLINSFSKERLFYHFTTIFFTLGQNWKSKYVFGAF